MEHISTGVIVNFRDDHRKPFPPASIAIAFPFRNMPTMSLRSSLLIYTSPWIIVLFVNSRDLHHTPSIRAAITIGLSAPTTISLRDVHRNPSTRSANTIGMYLLIIPIKTLVYDLWGALVVSKQSFLLHHFLSCCEHDLSLFSHHHQHQLSPAEAYPAYFEHDWTLSDHPQQYTAIPSVGDLVGSM